MFEQNWFIVSMVVFIGVLFLGRWIYARNARKANAVKSVSDSFTP